MVSLPRDSNRVTVIGATSNADGVTVVPVYADPTTHRLLTDTAASSSITVGTTTIASGTSGRVLYDNAGVVGESTTTGNGNVVLSTGPTLTSPNIGSATGSVSGNAGTATALQNARTIAGVSFDGTANIAIAASNLSNGVTGSGSVVLATSPSLTTPTLGAASATTINKVALTAPATASTLTIADGKTLTANSSITLAGTDSTTMTFPSTSATVARTDAAQTFTGSQTFSQVVATANAITASVNAATIPVTSKNNIVTNNSAATLTITMTTASAVNMQDCIVQILDASAAAQTITWVNTENSNTLAPTTSNGSTTLPLTVGFKYNSATSKWRCVASS